MVIAAAAAIALGVALGAGLVAHASAAVPRPGLRTIALTIHFSRFSTSHLTVAEGTLATFVIRNTDPIDHELIVGDQGVQDAVERGTELQHHAPGQVSVPAGAVVTTTYFFDRPGTLLFGCHLPGHWVYGMHGTIKVTGRGPSVAAPPRWCRVRTV